MCVLLVACCCCRWGCDQLGVVTTAWGYDFLFGPGRSCKRTKFKPDPQRIIPNVFLHPRNAFRSGPNVFLHPRNAFRRGGGEGRSAFCIQKCIPLTVEGDEDEETGEVWEEERSRKRRVSGCGWRMPLLYPEMQSTGGWGVGRKSFYTQRCILHNGVYVCVHRELRASSSLGA